MVSTYTVVADMLDAGGDFDVAALRLRGQHMLPRMRDTIKRAHKIGVTIVAATDSGYGPNSIIRIGQEITHFVEMGFTPLEAIQSATVRNAQMLRLVSLQHHLSRRHRGHPHRRGRSRTLAAAWLACRWSRRRQRGCRGSDVAPPRQSVPTRFGSELWSLEFGVIARRGSP